MEKDVISHKINQFEAKLYLKTKLLFQTCWTYLPLFAVGQVKKPYEII